MSIIYKIWNRGVAPLLFVAFLIYGLVMFCYHSPVAFCITFGILFSLCLLCYIKRNAILNALGGILEAGFRNQFPEDFLITLNPAINLLEYNGYEEESICDAGSETPSVTMRNEEKNSVLRITLIAPSNCPYVFKVSDESDSQKLFDEVSFDNINLLVEFLKEGGMKEPVLKNTTIQENIEDPFSAKPSKL